MMIDMDRRYLAAATLAGVGAALHVVALPLSGFAANVGPSVIGAVIWVTLALGLWRGSRFVAYLAFLMALIGFSASLSIAMTSIGLSQWVWSAIMVVDALVALTLFVVLWRPRPA